MLVLDLVGWATATAQSFRAESEDEDWTKAERQRFLDRSIYLEEWVALESPRREISQDLNLFLSLRSAMKPLAVGAGELPHYIQAVLKMSTQLPLERVEEPQFVLNANSGDLWVSDEPSMHAIRNHSGTGVGVHIETTSGLKGMIARLSAAHSETERTTK